MGWRKKGTLEGSEENSRKMVCRAPGWQLCPWCNCFQLYLFDSRAAATLVPRFFFFLFTWGQSTHVSLTQILVCSWLYLFLMNILLCCPGPSALGQPMTPFHPSEVLYSLFRYYLKAKATEQPACPGIFLSDLQHQTTVPSVLSFWFPRFHL